MTETDIDDASKPEFASLYSYSNFARLIRHQSRYVWDETVTQFLETVKATVRDRDVQIPKGRCFFRAQLGIDWRPIYDDEGNETHEEPDGFGSVRMKPRPNQATEGRANPAGVSMLYLATTEQAAASEVRPWIGSALSIAQFKLVRELKALDLSVGHGQSSLGNLKYVLGEETPDAEAKEQAVWTEIDNAFSRPVTRSDERGEYAPTQVLTELFRQLGYDALIYKSMFGERGYNLVLFNIEDALPINCAPYEVTAIDVQVNEIGNRWYHTANNKLTED
jgi:hypothetical protein